MAIFIATDGTRISFETLPTFYSGGHKGYSSHPQVDTGLGFTCDKEVLKPVQALNAKGFRTLSSCQQTEKWAIARRTISFEHSDPFELLSFCLHLKALAPKSGFEQRMILDNYHIPPDVFAAFDYTPEFDGLVLRAIQSYEIGSSNRKAGPTTNADPDFTPGENGVAGTSE